jgi:erythromycin esterase-like protein
MVKSRADLAAGAALPIAEDMRRLWAALGATLVAAVAGFREAQRVQDWAMHDGPDPSEAEQILVARRRGARTTVLDCWKAV